MGNWSGKRKPANKTRRKVKAAKRVERRTEETRVSTDSAEPGPRASSRSVSSTATTKPPARDRTIEKEPVWYEVWRDRIRNTWDSISPQAKVGTVLGIVIVLGVAGFQYFNTRPQSVSTQGRAPLAAPAPSPTVSDPPAGLTAPVQPSAEPQPSVDTQPTDGTKPTDASPTPAASAPPTDTNTASTASAKAVPDPGAKTPPAAPTTTPKPPPARKPAAAPVKGEDNPYQ